MSNRGPKSSGWFGRSTSIPELEATKEFANDRDRGVILSPGLDRSVRDFLSKARQASTPTVEKDEARRETLCQGEQ